MKLVWLRLTTLGFVGVLVATPPVQSESGFQTVGSVSVQAGEPQKVIAGQTFRFQLNLHPAPSGYGGGQIYYRFEHQPASSLVSPADGVGSIDGQVDLNDGQAQYAISLLVTDAMVPGIWKLTAVSLGRIVPLPVVLTDDVSFEIPSLAPVSIEFDAPTSAIAGQRLTVRVHIPNPPGDVKPECVLALWGELLPVRPDDQPLPPAYHVSLDPVELDLDKAFYELSGSLAPDLLPGTWRGQLRIGSYPRPTSRGGIQINNFPCRTPQLRGTQIFFLQVAPPPNLVTPRSVAALINPAQIKLMLNESERLKAKAADLGEQLKSKSDSLNEPLLTNNIQEALAAIDRTEKAFNSSGINSLPVNAASIFFNDIRRDYRIALENLNNPSARLLAVEPRFRPTSGLIGKSPSQFGNASKSVLASILRNAKAYEIAASTQALTFNLDIYSTPSGAKVSYALRGADYQPLDHETDWRIENLPRAFYFIVLEKDGYKRKETFFDAITSTGTSIQVRLEPARGRP